MKLIFNGHNEQYVVEQSLMSLFPGELPVYEAIQPGDATWAVISMTEENDLCHITVELSYQGSTAVRVLDCPLTGSDYEKEGQRRLVLARCFFLAAQQITGITPPWGMLTGPTSW